MRGVQCALLGLPWTLHTHSPASSSCRSNSARGAFPLWHPHPGAGPSSVAMHKAHAAAAMPKGPLCALLSPGLAAGHRALPGFSPLTILQSASTGGLWVQANGLWVRANGLWVRANGPRGCPRLAAAREGPRVSAAEEHKRAHETLASSGSLHASLPVRDAGGSSREGENPLQPSGPLPLAMTPQQTKLLYKPEGGWGRGGLLWTP